MFCRCHLCRSAVNLTGRYDLLQTCRRNWEKSFNWNWTSTISYCFDWVCTKMNVSRYIMRYHVIMYMLTLNKQVIHGFCTGHQHSNQLNKSANKTLQFPVPLLVERLTIGSLDQSTRCPKITEEIFASPRHPGPPEKKIFGPPKKYLKHQLLGGIWMSFWFMKSGSQINDQNDENHTEV